jgi:hypothetical protein
LDPSPARNRAKCRIRKLEEKKKRIEADRLMRKQRQKSY